MSYTFTKYSAGASQAIIDVTALPTENIDEQSIYRLTTEGAEIYMLDGGSVTLYGATLETIMGVKPNIVTYVVDELPETLTPPDVATYTFYFYIVESTGIAWFDSGEGAMTASTLFGGGMDKGWSDDVYAETEEGIYTVRTKTQTLHTNKDGEWTELVSKEYVDKAIAQVNTEVIPFTVDDTGTVQGIGEAEYEKIQANYHNIILAQGNRYYRCVEQVDGRYYFNYMRLFLGGTSSDGLNVRELTISKSTTDGVLADYTTALIAVTAT